MSTPARVFVSHTVHDPRDLALAHRLAEALSEGWNVRVWIAPESIPAGDRWEASIVSAVLEQCTHFLVIISSASVSSSWVVNEIALAKQRLARGGAFTILPLVIGDVGRFEYSNFLSTFQALRFRETFSDQVRELAGALSLSPPLPSLFRTLIEERTRHFTGRDEVFAAFQGFVASESNGMFLVSGDPGDGKTTILAEYVRRTGCPAHFNIGNAGIDTTSQFVASLSRQLGVRYGIDGTEENKKGASFGLRLGELLNAAVAAGPPGEPLVVVVDALDEVRPDAEAPGANVLHLPPVLPRGMYLLLSARRKEYHLTVQAPFREFDLQRDARRSRVDVEQYLRQRLADAAYGGWLQHRDWTIDRAVQELADQSKCNFMYLQHMLSDIRSGRYDTGDLPRGLKNYYNDHWRRMGMQGGGRSQIKLDVLQMLAVIRSPIPAALIARLLNIPRTEIHSILDEWREFLSVSQVGGESQFGLYHQSFQEFLRSQDVLRDVENPGRWDELLDMYFTERLLPP